MGRPLPTTRPPVGSGLAYVGGVLTNTAAAGSAYQVYLSRYPGFDTTGATDMSTLLQTIANLNNAGGSLNIILDTGTCKVGTTVQLNSNTDIYQDNGATFINGAAINGAMFTNKNHVASSVLTGLGVHAPVDHDIRFIGNGGLLDFNARGGAASGTDAEIGAGHRVSSRFTPGGFLVVGILLIGVLRPSFFNVQMYDSPSFFTQLHNCVDTKVEYIEGMIPLNNKYDNHDLLHFNGPCDLISVRDCYTNTDDDIVALNASDGHQNATTGAMTSAFFNSTIGDGSITRVNVNNVMMQACAQGVSFLSAFGRNNAIIGVTVDGLHGTNSSCPIWMHSNTGIFPQGYVDDVTLRNIDVQTIQQDARLAGAGLNPATVQIENFVGALTITGITRNNPFDARPLIQLYTGSLRTANVRSLVVSDCNSYDPMGNGIGAPIIWVQSGSKVSSLKLAGVIDKNNVPASALRLDGTCDNYQVSGIKPSRTVFVSGANTPTLQNTSSTLEPTIAVYSDSDFTKWTNGGSLAGFLPVPTALSSTWTIVDGSWTLNTAGYVQSGGGSADDATVDCKIKDGTLRYVVSQIGTGAGGSGFQCLLRYTNPNNFITAQIVATGITIYDITAGVATQLAQVLVALDPSASHTVVVTLNVLLVTAQVDGGTVASGTLASVGGGSANLTTTRFGIGSFSGAAPRVFSMNMASA